MQSFSIKFTSKPHLFPSISLFFCPNLNKCAFPIVSTGRVYDRAYDRGWFLEHRRCEDHTDDFNFANIMRSGFLAPKVRWFFYLLKC